MRTREIIENLLSDPGSLGSAYLFLGSYIDNLPEQTNWSALYHDLSEITDTNSVDLVPSISARWAQDDIDSAIDWLKQENHAKGIHQFDWQIENVLSRVPTQQALKWLQNSEDHTLRERVVQSYVDNQLERAFFCDEEVSSEAIVALEKLSLSTVTNPHFNHELVLKESFLKRMENWKL